MSGPLFAIMSPELRGESTMQQRRGSVINEICSLYDRLSESEKLIADFMMANQGDIPFMTTREIAARLTARCSQPRPVETFV